MLQNNKLVQIGFGKPSDRKASVLWYLVFNFNPLMNNNFKR